MSELTDHARSEQIALAARSILTARQLEAFRYYVEEEWSYNRISIQMGITETRARALVQRAVQKINIHFDKEAVT